jgi:hypothetical protein
MMWQCGGGGGGGGGDDSDDDDNMIMWGIDKAWKSIREYKSFSHQESRLFRVATT